MGVAVEASAISGVLSVVKTRTISWVARLADVAEQVESSKNEEKVEPSQSNYYAPVTQINNHGDHNASNVDNSATETTLESGNRSKVNSFITTWLSNTSSGLFVVIVGALILAYFGLK